MTTYGQELHWTPGPFDGTMIYGVRGCATPEAAWEAVVATAQRDGWTPPRWWQWWRKRDTKIPHWDHAAHPVVADEEE
jgi:hypothetical protein